MIVALGAMVDVFVLLWRQSAETGLDADDRGARPVVGRSRATTLRARPALGAFSCLGTLPVDVGAHAVDHSQPTVIP